jgi:VWFA-related protein
MALTAVVRARVSADPGQVRDSPPRFPGRTELVWVDAVALDSAGRPLGGLTRDEFDVREDQVSREVESFEAVAVGLPRSLTDSQRSKAAEAAPASAAPTVALVVFLDDLRMGPGQLKRAKAAARSAVAQLSGITADLAIVSPGNAVAVAGRLPQDRERLLLAIDGVSALRSQPGSPESLLRSTLLALESSLTAVTAAPGRKGLLLVSPGLLYRGALVPGSGLGGRSGMRSLDGSDRADFDRILEASRRAGVVVYFLDSVGLRTPLEGGGLTASDEMTRTAFADALVADSGGFAVRNANDLSRPIERIVGDLRLYYLLGFTPRPPGPAREFRRIQVSVHRDGVTVRARRGYYMEAAGPPEAASKIER